MFSRRQMDSCGASANTSEWANVWEWVQEFAIAERVETLPGNNHSLSIDISLSLSFFISDSRLLAPHSMWLQNIHTYTHTHKTHNTNTHTLQHTLTDTRIFV